MQTQRRKTKRLNFYAYYTLHSPYRTFNLYTNGFEKYQSFFHTCKNSVLLDNLELNAPCVQALPQHLAHSSTGGENAVQRRQRGLVLGQTHRCLGDHLRGLPLQRKKNEVNYDKNKSIALGKSKHKSINKPFFDILLTCIRGRRGRPAQSPAPAPPCP